jgi:Ti-type conjugative transfer relaxase TraA
VAIFHLSAKIISRKDGKSSLASAAYRAGVSLVDQRTGELFDYSRKQGVMYAEIVMPVGCTWAPDRSELWNAVEAKNKRADAQLARDFTAALPAELNHDERVELVRGFAKTIADRYRVAVDFAVHAPDVEGDNRNFHAHILVTTNRVEQDGRLGNKARELDGIAHSIAHAIDNRNGRAPNEIERLREDWATLTNEALERAGHDVRIDHRSYEEQGVELTPTTHIGVHAKGMDRRGLNAERIELHGQERREQAEQIAERPSIILDKITATQAVFTRQDIARELNRYIDDPAQFQALLSTLENSPELVQLAPEEKQGWKAIPAKYSTRDMIEVEQRMLDGAVALARTASHSVPADQVREAFERVSSLSEEQQQAVAHAVDGKQLAVIVGDAGTGKSFSMAVARDIWESQGYTVRGAALAGKAAEELERGSGIRSRTLASLEHAIKAGRDRLTKRDVLVVDEAGMIGSRQLGRVLSLAEKAGAKVVLLGDHKQLAAIEAGAAFRAVVDRVGASEITEIRRQREDWARQASQDFARGSVEAGMQAYADRGHVRMADTREGARSELAQRWLADRDQDEGKSSAIVLAYTNADVQALNTTIRDALRDRGELAEQAPFQAERGRREFAEGDRVVFLRNDAAVGVKNGMLGTVLQAEGGRLSVQLDNGKVRDIKQEDYAAVDHGYAVTVHKAQGVTVDRSYVLATPGMERSLAYVAMTRHRDTAKVFAGIEDYPGRADQPADAKQAYAQMVGRMTRQRAKESTLDFATRHGIDAEAAASSWIDRGRKVLNQLGQRLERAIEATRERFGEAWQQRQAGQQAGGSGRELVNPAEVKARNELQQVERGIEAMREAGMPVTPADMRDLRDAQKAVEPFDRARALQRLAESRQSAPTDGRAPVPETSQDRLRAAQEAGAKERTAEGVDRPAPAASSAQERAKPGQTADERLRAAQEAAERERTTERDRSPDRGWDRF